MTRRATTAPRPQRPPPDGVTARDQTRDQGLSLIELVLAMGLFALVAVMGAQALTGMMRLRGDLTARADQSAALSELTSLLRADLAALVPMLFYPPDRGPPRSALGFSHRENAVRLSLSRGGMARFDSPLPPTSQPARGMATGRVEWQLQNGQLSRAVWSSLMPADRSSYHQVATGLAPRLGGVQDLRLRSYWPQIGWVAGAQAHGLQPGAVSDGDQAGIGSEVYSSSLPLAVELTLVTGNFGEISLIESLK
ncbi:type II secretion system protein GspJ [Pseudophaeobacter sp.]|uniref:type II secretion system protein GspJ n=1 Tax=Pseudophaeobacter sp. TaxID=1971739 RepID=UPI003A979CD9